MLVVSGIPRSGTSMVMQILQSIGIEIYTDGKRMADQFNKFGYFEHENTSYLPWNTDWLEEVQEKAVKIPMQALRYLPTNYQYKVIFISRDIKDVLESQHRMFGLNISQFDKLEAVYKKQAKRVQEWAQKQVGLLNVDYSDKFIVQKIVEFFK
jgi:hypothetical protein